MTETTLVFLAVWMSLASAPCRDIKGRVILAVTKSAGIYGQIAGVSSRVSQNQDLLPSQIILEVTIVQPNTTTTQR